MKRDIELQKPVAHTSIRLGKRESDQKLKCMIVQKAKGYPIKEKYQKAFSQWDVIVLKNQKFDRHCWVLSQNLFSLYLCANGFVHLRA